MIGAVSITSCPVNNTFPTADRVLNEGDRPQSAIAQYPPPSLFVSLLDRDRASSGRITRSAEANTCTRCVKEKLMVAAQDKITRTYRYRYQVELREVSKRSRSTLWPLKHVRSSTVGNHFNNILRRCLYAALISDLASEKNETRFE